MSLRVYIRFWSYIAKKNIFLFIGYAVFLICMASLTPIFAFLWKQYIEVVSVDKDVTYGVFLLC